jgi:hypothetical protein
VWVMNRVAKELRGSDVSFDPMQAMIEAYGSFQDADGIGEGSLLAGGRLVGEGLSNLPGGSTAAAFYPEFGAKDILGTGINLPTREKLFGDKDPTRFGNGLMAGRGLLEPQYLLAPPFGGRQIKNTYEGGKTLLKGYAETAAGKVMTPVESSPYNIGKGLIFGKNSLQEVQDYREADNNPLGDKQSEIFKLLGPKTEQGKAFFGSTMNNRAAAKEVQALKEGKSMPKDDSFIPEIQGVLFGKKQVMDGSTELSGDGIRKLSDGKFFSERTGTSYDSEAKAKIANAKDTLEKSDSNFMVFDNFVLRKSAMGEVSAISKDSFDSQLNSAKLSGYKKNENLKEWRKTAGEQLDLLNRMMMDPSIDELEKIQIQNQAETLIDQYQKYAAYGGFTKPKKKKVEPMSVSEKYFFDTIVPKSRTFRMPKVAKAGAVQAKKYRFNKPKFNWQKVSV